MTADFNNRHHVSHALENVPDDFPWAEVFERLDTMEGLADGAPDQSETITRMMHQLLLDAQGTRINPKTIGLRLIALGWVLRPSYFPGSPSLRELANRCGVSPSALAYFSGEVSRVTGIRNPAQRHAGNWRAPERSSRQFQAEKRAICGQSEAPSVK